MAKRDRNAKIAVSSGNVFADLRLPNAGEKQTRVRLAVVINQIITRERLGQVEAARRLNINQPKISALRNYKLNGFSVERLMNFVNALGHDVEISIRTRTSRRPARTVVRAA